VRYSKPMRKDVLKRALVSSGIVVQISAANKLGPYLSNIAKRQVGEKQKSRNKFCG